MKSYLLIAFWAGVALVFLSLPTSAAPLYTTQGLNASGFTNDSAPCTVSVIQDSSGNMVETHSVTNDCLTKDIAYLDYSCYIYPANGTVSYTVMLDERYSVGNYTAQVRCGAENSSAFTFIVTAPSLTVIDFNAYPQFLTTMKLVARTETELATDCLARIISADNITNDVIPGQKGAIKGLFTFEHWLLWEAPYRNYTLNVTCNDGSTYQTVFKPIFIDEGQLSAYSFGLGFQAIVLVLILVIGLILVIALHITYKVLTQGGN